MYSKEEVIEALLFAESENDEEEVEKLYKLLFRINDNERKNITDNNDGSIY